MPSEPPDKKAPSPSSAEQDISLAANLNRRRARFAERWNPRERLGDFLNAFEDNSSLRWKCFAAFGLAIVLGAGGWWLLPRWREESSIRVARQWLDAGKLERAGEAVGEALARAPKRVETWELAAEYARALGQKQKAASCLRQAATLNPRDPELSLNWAAAAIAAGNLDEAEGAINGLPAEVRAHSARSERLTGEVARQRGDITAARTHFESAVRLGGAAPENQIPLAVVLLGSEVAADQHEGRAVLERWKKDPAWSLDVLRALLANAVVHGDRNAMPALAAELIVHPGRERADTFNSLLAFAKSDSARFPTALGDVERAASTDATQVAELVGWLSGNGYGADAIRWADGLPTKMSAVPPVAVAVAEARRVLRDWPALKETTTQEEWGEVEFLRQTYLAVAERALGNAANAEKLWEGVRDSSRLNGGRALFLAGTVYTWGWQTEAVELWWIAVEQPGVATSAFGALARHYQVQRDAEGLYRAFRGLNEIKSGDPRIANNYAYFAAVTGHNLGAAERITGENLEAAPAETAYLATRAFVLHRAGKNEAALALLPKLTTAAGDVSAFAFTRGLVLAANGQATEARSLLQTVNERTLTFAELELFKQARSAAARP